MTTREEIRKRDVAVALANDALHHHADIFADGAEHARRQVVAFLRKQADYYYRNGELTPYIRDLIASLERGEHVTEPQP